MLLPDFLYELWGEYCADSRQTGEIPYGYTQFRYHYYAYVQQNKATMHIEHKPGYEVEVDWPALRFPSWTAKKIRYTKSKPSTKLKGWLDGLDFFRIHWVLIR
ncbi:DUF1294 domain-containing protein [Desulfitobacterium sp. AusDCA]